jgi:hypothetical protein
MTALTFDSKIVASRFEAARLRAGVSRLMKPRRL